MKNIPVLLVLLFTFFLFIQVQVSEAHGTRSTVPYCMHHSRDLAKRACIVRVVFAPVGQSGKAVRVGMCESRLNPRAWSKNRAYYGMFQFGSSERDAYNYGHTPLSQSRAARRMYDSRGWQPWPRCSR